MALPAVGLSEESIGNGIKWKKEIDQPRDQANSQPLTVVNITITYKIQWTASM
jgi:hypothetical protein